MKKITLLLSILCISTFTFATNEKHTISSGNFSLTASPSTITFSGLSTIVVSDESASDYLANPVLLPNSTQYNPATTPWGVVSAVITNQVAYPTSGGTGSSFQLELLSTRPSEVTATFTIKFSRVRPGVPVTDVLLNVSITIKPKPLITYSSSAISEPFVKNNCEAGATGSSVTYPILEGAFTSTISQIDADSKARNHGQAYANSNGKCTYYYYSMTKISVTEYIGRRDGGYSGPPIHGYPIEDPLPETPIKLYNVKYYNSQEAALKFGITDGGDAYELTNRVIKL